MKEVYSIKFNNVLMSKLCTYIKKNKYRGLYRKILKIQLGITDLSKHENLRVESDQ